jgi:hypothetical protein
MSAVVVNHLKLTVLVDDLAEVVDREFAPVFRAQPGFERFLLVRAGSHHAIAVIIWADEAAAAAGASVVGPGLFARHLVPVLAEPQEHSIGPAVVEIGPA